MTELDLVQENAHLLETVDSHTGLALLLTPLSLLTWGDPWNEWMLALLLPPCVLVWEAYSRVTISDSKSHYELGDPAGCVRIRRRGLQTKSLMWKKESNPTITIRLDKSVTIVRPQAQRDSREVMVVLVYPKYKTLRRTFETVHYKSSSPTEKRMYRVSIPSVAALYSSPAEKRKNIVSNASVAAMKRSADTMHYNHSSPAEKRKYWMSNPCAAAMKGSAGTMHYKRSSTPEKSKYCMSNPSVAAMRRSACTVHHKRSSPAEKRKCCMSNPCVAAMQRSAGTMHYKRSSPAEKSKYCMSTPNIAAMKGSAGTMNY
ncbi:hypothetical protein NDU88_010902 [Pleurodeles waltl]|uniref:Uncharacterized protein n=1 Tax=Pleurodeles waltl TaxID=8319 RepID=A0AAV7S5B6_PLEWA|nr:hypothetical protein NDU88_010902 [Pleurodeles waltl]